MGFSSIRQGLMAALLASFLALFVLVPTVDAMTCGPEASQPEASILVLEDPSDEDSHGGDVQHATCAHGHCHDAGVSGPASRSSLLDGVRPRTPGVMRPADLLVSNIVAGPERPPIG